MRRSGNCQCKLNGSLLRTGAAVEFYGKSITPVCSGIIACITCNSRSKDAINNRRCNAV